MSPEISAHLHAIDPSAWPGIAMIPHGFGISQRARLAEAYLARACAKAEISLRAQDADVPTITVLHEAAFRRIAASGWLGFAEAYLAGEWRSNDLATVLSRLISAGFNPPTLPGSGVAPTTDATATVGELPSALFELSSGSSLSGGSGLFTSGVATTVRESLRSFAPGAGHRGRASHYYADVTRWTGPRAELDPADLPPAQNTRADALLDMAGVRSGSHVLELPCADALLGYKAAVRGAAVDVVTSDEAFAAAVEEQYILAGVSESVDINLNQTLPGMAASPIPTRIRGRYDAVVSTGRLELLTEDDRGRYVRLIDHVLDVDGRAVLQTVVATERMSRPARSAMDCLRAYIWPALYHDTFDELRKRVEGTTRLRVEHAAWIGEHHAASLALSEQIFSQQESAAAAAGFDVVFRRLWEYQNALFRALFKLGCLDCVQVAFHSRVGAMPR